ncbi:MAG: hypothetical protein GKR90_18860 [Pseudomonadales bacterium]|nr:hypothetical protein [Pseudomonadales bacterium]
MHGFISVSEHQTPVERTELNQETTVYPGPTDADVNAEALRAEVAKWQERVPKLAGALRERTDELAQARDEIRTLKQQAGGANSDVTVRARDELIEELESKSKELKTKVQTLAGELRSMEIALGEAQEDAENWKSKWRGVTGSLDELSAEKTEKESNHQSERLSFDSERANWDEQRTQLAIDQKEHLRLTDEIGTLRKRNEQLVETTEMANVQIVTLGEELTSLVARAEQAESSSQDLIAQHAEAEGALEKVVSELVQSKREFAIERSELVSSHQSEVASRDEALTKALDDVDGLRRAADEAFKKAEQSGVAQRSEVARLEGLHTVAINERNRALAEVAEAGEALQNLKSEHETQLAEIQSTSAQALQSKEEQFGNAQNQVTALQTELAAAKARVSQELSDYETARTDLEQSLKTTEDKLSTTTAEVSRLEGCLSEAIENQNRFQREREIQTQRIIALEEEVAQVELDAEQKILGQEALQAELKKLQTTLQDRTQLVQNLEEERSERLRNGTHLQGTVDRLEQDLTAERQRNETLKAHVATVEARVNDQRQLMEQIERELSEEQAKLVEQRRLLEVEQRQRQDTENRLASGDDKRIAEEKARLAEELKRQSDEEIATLNGQLMAISTEHESERDELQEKLRQATATQEAAVLERDRSQNRIEELTNELSRHSSQAEALAETLQDNLSEMETELHKVRSDAKAVSEQLGADLTSAQEERAAAEQNLELSQDRVTELEEEARATQAEFVAYKAETVDAIEVQALGEQLRELENKFRERTRELDELRWRTEQEKQQSTSSSDEKMVLVLNQQLEDARAEIERLKGKVSKSNTASEPDFVDADLTQLKGVGDKLAQQLRALGIQSVSQIAAMDESDLDDEEHLLYGYRSRLLRDEWIAQARGIIDK